MDSMSFEHLNGQIPEVMLQQHPQEALVVMQVVTRLDHHQAWRSAIWNRETGKIVWAPEDVVVMTWLHDGKEIGLVHELYHGSGKRSAFQTDYTYQWEHYAWPDRSRISGCPIEIPMGCPTVLVVSPQEDLVLVQWFDQNESGFTCVRLSKQGDIQVKECSLPMLTNLTAVPVFSPDGRYIVVPYQNEWEWWMDSSHEDLLNDEEVPVEAGEYQVGAIAIFDRQEQKSLTIPVMTVIENEWYPPATDTLEGLIGKAVFLDEKRFEILLPTGELKNYALQ